MGSDHKGRVVEELLELKNLVCIDDGSDARIDISKRRYSAIDLTIMSEILCENLCGKY